jgi:hypothetical protein
MEENPQPRPYGFSAVPVQTTPPRAAAAPQMEARDALFVALSFVIGFCFCELVLFGGLGIAVPLFYALFYTVAILYLSRRHKVINRRSVLTFIPVVLMLLCFALYDNPVLMFFNVLVLWALTALNLSAMAGLESRPLFWAGTFFDILSVTFKLPFRHLGMSAAVMGKAGKSSRRSAAVKVLVTLLVVSPVVLIVLALLSSSDSQFARLLSDFTSLITRQVWQTFFKVILGLLLTFPVFSLLYSLRYGRRPPKHPLDGFLLRLGGLDSLITSTALAVFSLIYVLYIALQAKYFFSALGGVLPQGFTYAEYARKGFFELIAVAVINFCLIAATIAFTRRHDGRPTRSCRISVSILTGLTLLLIVTAASKMALYIGRLGLTPLRVYVSFVMILLAAVSVFVLLRMLRPKFPFYRFAAVGAIALYLALNFAGVDSLIARHNIALYQSGVSSELDTGLFYELSDSAVPQIAPLQNDARYGSEITAFLQERDGRLKSAPWQSGCLASWLAGNTLHLK